MVALNIDPATPLKNLIVALGVTETVYVNGAYPSSALPASFILIEVNGGINAKGTKRTNAQCTLAVSVYTKLLSTGAVNAVLSDLLLGKFQDMLASAVKSDIFTYELVPNPMVYSGKSLVSGFSTKVLNVNCYINY